MKLKSVIALLALTTVAVAQTGAPTLYANARTSHGVTALNSLKTLKYTANFTSGSVNFIQSAAIDFERGIFRLETKSNNVVNQVYLLTPTTAKIWTSQGTKNLDETTKLNLQFVLIEGVLALRPAASIWTTMTSAGALQIAGQDGTGLTLASAQQNTTVILATDGTLLAQRLSAGGRDVQLAFSDYRVTSGLKFPYLERQYQNGAVVSTVSYTTVIVNPVLTDADFVLPQ
jgi:hypothetical protein